MTLKHYFPFFLVQLLLCFSSIAFAQDGNNSFSHEMAAKELEEIQTKLKAGESFELNPKLFEYIYSNSATFPHIPEDAEIEEKIKIFSPVFNQLTFILKSLVIESRDSVSIEHAMIMATLGYQSEKLLSLSNDYMSTLDKNDPTYSIRAKGFNQAETGIQNYLLGYVSTTFVENNFEGVDTILTSSLIEFAPKIIDAFPKDKRKSTIKLIKKYVGNKNDIRLKDKYEELLNVL